MQSNRNILKSGIWSYVENGSAQIFSLVTFLFIARLVGPAEFGVVAIASAWSALFMSLTEAGIGDAVVQNTSRDQRFISTAFWLNMGLAIAGTLLVILITFTIKLSDDPKISQYLAVLALGIPITALGNIPTSLLRAELKNKDLARRGIASDLVGCFAGIIAAQAGLGGWAIIIQSLLSNSIKTIMVWKCSHWFPTYAFQKKDASDIFRFGYKALGTGILSSISARTDRFVLGFFFSAREVGIYSIASEGINRLSSLLIMGLAQVMFPHYSSLKDDAERLSAAFFKSLTWCCYIGAAAFGGLLLFSPFLASGVLGSKWENSIPIIQTLTLLGIMQCTLIVPMTLYKSAGRPGLGLMHAFLQVVMNILFVIVFHQFGLTAIAVALALRPLLTILVHIWTTSLVISHSTMRFIKSISSGLALYSVIWLLNQWIGQSLHSPYIAICAGTLVIIGALLFRAKNLIAELKS